MKQGVRLDEKKLGFQRFSRVHGVYLAGWGGIRLQPVLRAGFHAKLPVRHTGAVIVHGDDLWLP